MIRAVICFVVVYIAGHFVKSASLLTFFSWKYFSKMTVEREQRESQLIRLLSLLSPSISHQYLPLHTTECLVLPPLLLLEWGEAWWGSGGTNLCTGNWIWCVSLFSAGVKGHQPQGNSEWKSSTLTLVVPKLCEAPFNRQFILVALTDKKGFSRLHPDSQARYPILRTKTDSWTESETCRFWVD